jgi:hypothetical protein
MKGYCDKFGFPREMPWLSCLEPFAIVERFNSVLRGFANFYAEFISAPSDLYRWLYIVRYSCLKTLAQKYATSIKKILQRFYTPSHTGKTIAIKVSQTIGEKVYEKTWRLLTAKEVIQSALQIERYDKIKKDFDVAEYSTHLGKPHLPKHFRVEGKGLAKGLHRRPCEARPWRGRVPRVTDDRFLDTING